MILYFRLFTLLGDVLLGDNFLVFSYLQQFISSRAVQSSRSPLRVWSHAYSWVWWVCFKTSQRKQLWCSTLVTMSHKWVTRRSNIIHLLNIKYFPSFTTCLVEFDGGVCGDYVVLRAWCSTLQLTFKLLFQVWERVSVTRLCHVGCMRHYAFCAI